MKVEHEILNEDLIRISSFLENINNKFETVDFIKNFEVLNLLLYIYRSALSGNDVPFKALQNYVKKSDVYLCNFLKSGLETGYLSVSVSTTDKRVRNYNVTSKCIEFLEDLKFKADYPSKLK